MPSGQDVGWKKKKLSPKLSHVPAEKSCAALAATNNGVYFNYHLTPTVWDDNDDDWFVRMSQCDLVFSAFPSCSDCRGRCALIVGDSVYLFNHSALLGPIAAALLHSKAAFTTNPRWDKSLEGYAGTVHQGKEGPSKWTQCNSACCTRGCLPTLVEGCDWLSQHWGRTEWLIFKLLFT